MEPKNKLCEEETVDGRAPNTTYGGFSPSMETPSNPWLNEINFRFTERATGKVNAIREAGRNFAFIIAQCCPRAREERIAVEKIEEAVLWATEGIARNE